MYFHGGNLRERSAYTEVLPRGGLSNPNSRETAVFSQIGDTGFYGMRHGNEVPTTYLEYKRKNPDKYYQLGGLGPCHIGSDSWIKGMEKLERMKSYGINRKLKQAQINDF